MDGARYDSGDGINGMGAELGGGGMLQLDPATRGSGLSVRLMPSYGDAACGVNELWDRGVTDAVHEPGLPRRAHLDGEVAYGLPGFRGTPFGGFRLDATGTRAFTSGVRYDLGAGLGLRLAISMASADRTLGVSQASIRRSPLGSGIGRPSSRALSIQNCIASLMFPSAVS